MTKSAWQGKKKKNKNGESPQKKNSGSPKEKNPSGDRVIEKEIEKFLKRFEKINLMVGE